MLARAFSLLTHAKLSTSWSLLAVAAIKARMQCLFLRFPLTKSSAKKRNIWQSLLFRHARCVFMRVPDADDLHTSSERWENIILHSSEHENKLKFIAMFSPCVYLREHHPEKKTARKWMALIYGRAIDFDYVTNGPRESHARVVHFLDNCRSSVDATEQF